MFRGVPEAGGSRRCCDYSCPVLPSLLPCRPGAGAAEGGHDLHRLADMAQNVAGDAADVVSLTKPGPRCTTTSRRPATSCARCDADLILWNGLRLEHWFERFLRNLRDVPSVVVTEGVEPIASPRAPTPARPNPHAWMSPADALIYVENIRAALAAADPGERRGLCRERRRLRRARSGRSPRRSASGSRRSPRTGAGSPPRRAPSPISHAISACGELYIWPINADQRHAAADPPRDRPDPRARRPGGLLREHRARAPPSRSRARPARPTAACSTSTASRGRRAGADLSRPDAGDDETIAETLAP